MALFRGYRAAGATLAAVALLASAGCGSSSKKPATSSTAATTATTAAPSSTGQAAGSGKLGADDIAVVDGQHVTKAMLSSALALSAATLKQQGSAAPAPGSSAYTQYRAQVIAELISIGEAYAQAAKLGVHVSDAQISSQLEKIVKQSFAGSQAQFATGLKGLGLTLDDVRFQLRTELVQQGLAAKITSGVKVDDSAVRSYYAKHTGSYTTPDSRQVREILVGKGKQALAQQIYTKLQSGASFASLAKQYSQDPGSKNIGGKFTAMKGSDVPEFDAAVFSNAAKTGAVLKPVDTSAYGWFVIQPTADIKPGGVQPESKVASTIRTQLVQQKKQAAAKSWATTVTKAYCASGAFTFRPGFEPQPNPCTASAGQPATSTTTTTSG